MHATLTDFGLSRVITSSSIIGTRTMMAGSPGFQAPEQLRAESVGPHCDVYAFGCVMIVLFQERVLWPNLNPYQILCKVSINNESPDTSYLKGDLKSLCERCVRSMDTRPVAYDVLCSLFNISQDLIRKA